MTYLNTDTDFTSRNDSVVKSMLSAMIISDGNFYGGWV